MAVLADRAVIHIGTQKTGTSSLQSWLASHRPLLASAGFFYPHSCKWSDDHSHNSLPAAMLKDESLQGGGEYVCLLDELLAEIDSQPRMNMILSSEMLEKAPRFAPRHVVKLLESLRARFRHIEVVYCLRTPSILADSIFRQWVQSYETRFAGDPLAMAEREIPNLNFTAIAQTWLDTGCISQIRGFWYEGHAPGAHLLRALRLLGLGLDVDLERVGHAEWENRSLDGRLLQIKHALNRNLSDKTAHDAFLAALRLVAKRHPSWSTRTTIFDSTSLAAFEAKCARHVFEQNIQMSDGGEAYRPKATDSVVPDLFVPLDIPGAMALLRRLADQGEPAPLQCLDVFQIPSN